MKSRRLLDYITDYEDVIKTVSEVSINKETPLIDSEFKCICFDEVKTQYFNKNNSKAYSCSNDALISFKGIDCFVEFKDTDDLDGKELYIKIRDSLLIYLDIMDVKLSDTKDSLGYILVYNPLKNKNYDYKYIEDNVHGFSGPYNREVKHLRKNLEGLYFKYVYCMTPSEFELELKKYSEEI